VTKSVKVTEFFRIFGSRDLDQLTDDVLDELMSLEAEDLCDAEVSATLSSGIVEISIVAIGDDFDEAVTRGSAAISQAILASGNRQERAGGAGVGFDKQGERSDLLVQA